MYIARCSWADDRMPQMPATSLNHYGPRQTRIAISSSGESLVGCPSGGSNTMYWGEVFPNRYVVLTVARPKGHPRRFIRHQSAELFRSVGLAALAGAIAICGGAEAC